MYFSGLCFYTSFAEEKQEFFSSSIFCFPFKNAIPWHSYSLLLVYRATALFYKAEDGGRKLQVLTNGSKSVGRESLFHLGANFFVVSGDIENLEQALIVYRPAQQAWKNPSKQHTQNIT